MSLLLFCTAFVEQGPELLNVLHGHMWYDQYPFICYFIEECPEDVTTRSWGLGYAVQQAVLVKC